VSKRQNLKLRVIRELALWSLFSHDIQSVTANINPFVLRGVNHKTWRQDFDLWRKIMGDIKPKERAINVWRNEDLWTQCDLFTSGIFEHKECLDLLIGRSSMHWKIERMSGVDRNILRLATYELCFREKVPARAILNEAIELGKRYGSVDSGRFINGVLDRIAHDLNRVPPKKNKKPVTSVEVIDLRPQGSSKKTDSSL
jgi:transcription antitermination factor NusB